MKYNIVPPKYFKQEEFKLCYIDDNIAYFTSKDLKRQWGDDWDDAPYEHNAGIPYEPSRPDLPIEDRINSFSEDWNKDGSPKWEIYKIMFETEELVDPAYNTTNSSYSVEMINAGAISWLLSPSWSNNKIFIQAGESIEKFVNKIKESGGDVFFPIK